MPRRAGMTTMPRKPEPGMPTAATSRDLAAAVAAIATPGASSASSADTPTLARNVVHFVRVLRGAGLPMSPAQAVDALAALRWIDLGRRDDVRAALAALLVCAPDERELFDAAFDLFWRDPDWEGKLRALLLPKVLNGMPPPRR